MAGECISDPFERLRRVRAANPESDDEDVIGLESSDDDDLGVSDSDSDFTVEESDSAEATEEEPAPGPSSVDLPGSSRTSTFASVRARREVVRRAVRGRGRMPSGRGASRRHRVQQFDYPAWQKTRYARRPRPFSERVGVQKRFSASAAKLHIFLQFLTIGALEMIVSMTNTNAVRKRLNAGMEEEWRPTDVEEMMAFLGLIIIFGIIRMPRLNMYWQQKSWIYDWPTPNKIMPRDRFFALWKYLNFCDESTAPSPNDPMRDRLYKIRPLVEFIKPQLLSIYTPDKQISIDESMIPFKGRISFKQFIPSKRVRFGIKVWVLAEAKTGYISNLQIYTGKDPTAQEIGLATRVVNDLIASFKEKGYHLYVDNFYTSPQLFRDLFKEQVYACGTVRLGTRGFPTELIYRGRVTRGSTDWRMSNELLAQSWMDNRAVYFLSTIHEPEYSADVPESCKTVNRRGRRGEDACAVPCPPLLHDYNNFMGGVDLNDAMRKYYNIGRRSRTWYRRVFFYLVEVILHNSMVVAKAILPEAEKKKFKPLEWRKGLITELIGATRTIRTPSRRRSEDTEQRMQNVGLHIPVFGGIPLECKVCSKKASIKKSRKRQRPTRTSISCKECKVNLCIAGGKNCFDHWHTKKEFWRA